MQQSEGLSLQCIITPSIYPNHLRNERLENSWQDRQRQTDGQTAQADRYLRLPLADA